MLMNLDSSLLYKNPTSVVFSHKHFMQQEDDVGSKLRVWFADVETGKARPLFQSPDICLNAVFDKYAIVSGCCI